MMTVRAIGVASDWAHGLGLHPAENEEEEHGFHSVINLGFASAVFLRVWEMGRRLIGAVVRNKQIQTHCLAMLRSPKCTTQISGGEEEEEEERGGAGEAGEGGGAGQAGEAGGGGGGEGGGGGAAAGRGRGGGGGGGGGGDLLTR